MNSLRTRIFTGIMAWAILAGFLFATLLPFYWMVATSIKPTAELFAKGSPFLVAQATLNHYSYLLKNTQFIAWFFNSIVVSLSTTLISLVLGSLAAYGVARSQSSLASSVARIVLVIYLIPRVVLFIPLYEVLNKIHLLDSLSGLIMAYLTFSLPYITWILIGYFKSVPKELDEAALIDGTNRLGALQRVIIPIVKPGLVASSIFTFTMSWNEFMYPLTFIQTGLKLPFTVGIAALQQGDVFSWGPLMAAGSMAAVPTLIAYSIIQRYIVRGLTAGAVKG